MEEVILVINSGSSSIKFSLFCWQELNLLYYGIINDIFDSPGLSSCLIPSWAIVCYMEVDISFILHSDICKKICDRLSWLGTKIVDDANKHGSAVISANDSKIIVSVIPTNEEYMIAKSTERTIENE